MKIRVLNTVQAGQLMRDFDVNDRVIDIIRGTIVNAQFNDALFKKSVRLIDNNIDKIYIDGWNLPYGSYEVIEFDKPDKPDEPDAFDKVLYDLD